MTKKSKLAQATQSETMAESIEKKVFGGNEDHSGIHKKIISCKVVKDGQMQVKFTYVAPDGIKYSGGLNPEGLIHSDMRECLTRLIPHLINICEQVESPVKKGDVNGDPEYISEEFKEYSVEGFHITGSGDDESLSIFGEKLITHGSLSLQSPPVNPASNYDFIDELFELIEQCRYEAEAYINGKFAAKQQVMDFDSMEATAAQA